MVLLDHGLTLVARVRGMYMCLAAMCEQTLICQGTQNCAIALLLPYKQPNTALTEFTSEYDEIPCFTSIFYS